MSSILVIKVKFGDTLRRFNALVVENKRLEFSLIQLREMIRKLYSLGVDDDFTLTYTDNDGDIVTLVEDCDLNDVVFQGLNPFRITVNLKMASRGGLFDVESGQSRTSENVLPGVEEVVKNVPEPFCGIHSQSVSTIQTGDGEFSSLSGSHKSADLIEEIMQDEFRKVKAKAVDFGVYSVPDLNNAPPLQSELLTSVAASSACSNNTGKGNSLFTRCVEDELSKLNVNLFNECPFSGTREDVVFQPSRKEDGYPTPLFKGNRSQFVPEDLVFHTGVKCDICGVQPIIGPRFISKVKYNYDICNVCYQKSGSKAEYVRIDDPLMYRQVLKTFHHIQKRHCHKFSACEPFKVIAARNVPLVNKVKLNSRFILDVNVVDGTVMAPSVRFTKIWRMKNTGNIVWPMGTQLVWIDGKKISNELSVDLEIPACGLPVDSELDIAVDFVAPDLPGEYVSYWRMSSPSGRKFGQRVWVVIQVDNSHDHLSGDFNQLNLNLNLPPQNNGLNDFVADVNVDPLMSICYSPSGSLVSPKHVEQQRSTVDEVVVELSAEVLDEDNQQLVSEESTSKILESVNVNGPSNDTFMPVVSQVACPLVDSDKEVGALASFTMETLPLTQLENFIETTESKQLSGMHINQAHLNNEISKTVNSHLKCANNFPCGMFGMDRILDELEKMGFSDTMKNIELVLKNKGSIKGAVMDLIASEKSLSR